jgi:cytochrome c oxidase subunit IV
MAEDIVKPKTYVLVWAALMCLTATTAAVARLDLAPFNGVLALLIAFTKASLVVLFFMHLYYSSRLTKLVMLAALLWFAILMCITMSDYLTRGWLNYPAH